MAINAVCGACGWSGRVKDGLEGRRVKCPKCAAPFVVGAAAEPRVAQPVAARSAAARPAAAQQAPAAARASTRPAPPPAAPRRPFTPVEAAALVTGRITPVKTTLAYRLALAAAAFVMVLLPLTYLAMIAGVGLGVRWHLVNHTGWLTGHGLRGRAALVPVLAYATPAVVGGVIVLFMLKPLLARRPAAFEPQSLERHGEPTLFALVESVCRAVGAPFPKRIDVDMQVNASASHRRGLLSIFGDDLVLTIGLPLVAGTTVEQFAGILAHEFGHFTQGAGMGFGAVVGRINAWFARVVWERDAWDVRLREWSNGSGLWGGIILTLARGAVWLTRRILFGLMWIGHAVTCHLSRQMEYDADLHQLRLVGSTTFADTFRRLPVLSVADNTAAQTLGDAWVEGITVDSIPDLVVLGAERIPAEERAAIDKAAAEQTAGAFDTHPAIRDRVARAEIAGEAGLLACQEPAARLFTDFPRLCRELTLAIHQRVHPGKLLAPQLRPAAEILARRGAEQDAMRAASRWLDEETSPFLPFPGQGGSLRGTAAECLEAHRDAQASLRAEPVTPRDQWDAIFAPLMRHQQTFVAASVVATGASYRDSQAGVTLRTAADVDKIRREAWEDFRTRSAALVQRRIHTDRRLAAAIGWLDSSEAESRIADAARRRDEASTLFKALAALELRRGEWIRVAAEMDVLAYWIQQAGDESVQQNLAKALPPAFTATATAINSLRQPLLGEPYPLDHADPSMTIGRYLVPEDTNADSPEGVLEAGQRLLSLFPWLAWQIFGRLALHAEKVEAVIDRQPGAIA